MGPSYLSSSLLDGARFSRIIFVIFGLAMYLNSIWLICLTLFFLNSGLARRLILNFWFWVAVGIVILFNSRFRVFSIMSCCSISSDSAVCASLFLAFGLLD